MMTKTLPNPQKTSFFKKAILCFLCILGYSNLPCQDWELYWQDEFDQNSLDLSTWNIEVNDLGGYNNELQYYTDRPENIKLEDGHLVITGRKEDYLTREYTSARINSRGKRSFQYGKMEARMKLPYGNGMWPAFWMMGNTGQWPACGEIDIMELVGGNACGYDCGDNKSHGYMWYKNAANLDESTGTMAPLLESGKYADDFHLFAVEWNETSIKWLIDDVVFHEEDISADYLTEFYQPFYFLLNVAIGGDWPKSPDASTVFPQKMLVDYVRVYKPSTSGNEQNPYGGTAQIIPGTIEAEDFDEGGQGVAYNETTTANQGDAPGYRNTEVDIEDNGLGGNNVGYITKGEWLEYTVNVIESGVYNIMATVSNGDPQAGAFHLEMDEILIGQSVAVQNTGGWTSWTEVSLGTAELGAGEHILRFYADDVYFNLDKLAFSIVTANTTSLLKRDNHALVFPNPFHSSLSVQPIEQGHLMHVEVFNAHGSKVFETQTLERVRIKEAKSWSPGVYFLKTTQGDDTKIRTIVKE